jgi:hypothetical protein
MKLVGWVAATALLAAASAPGAAAPRKAKSYDPNREICKSRQVVGSRVKRVRECATAQQWEDMELQERMGLMRKQFNGDPGCNGGQPCRIQDGGRDSPI